MILAARGMFLSRLMAQTIAPSTIRAECCQSCCKKKKVNENSCILINDNTDNVATKSTPLVAEEMKLL
jgi:hypothetical protein